MPEIVGNLRPPRLSAAPPSPALGEMYYNTITNLVYFWNGTAWVSGAGPAGLPGYTPSCKAQSAISFAAADMYYRGIGINLTTVAFDDFGNSFSPASQWTCRQTGRYLILGSYQALANTGDVGIDVGGRRSSARVTKGTDASLWGTGVAYVTNYNANDAVSLAGYHSGGGGGTFIFEAIRLDATGQSGGPALVTSLPATPFDGQEVYYVADATARVIWHLRYNAASASAYKWEFVGGPPLTVRSTVALGSAGGVWFATPVLTIPRAGDYILGFIADANGAPTTANLQVWWGAQLGDGTTAFGVDYGSEFRFIAASVTGNPSIRYTLSNQNSLKAALAAGATIKLKSNATNWDYNSAYQIISALPVRVS